MPIAEGGTGTGGSSPAVDGGGGAGGAPTEDSAAQDGNAGGTVDSGKPDSDASPGGSEAGSYDGGVSSSVVPIDWSAFPVAAPADATAALLKKILLNSNKYGLTTWYDSVKKYKAQTGDYLDLGGILENNIRAPAAEAVGLAVFIALGAYYLAWTGVSLADAKAITVRLIGSVAYHHKANTSDGWGWQNDSQPKNEIWQSAHWAAYAGQAAWLLWSELSPKDQEYVRKMVEREANRFNTATPPVYRDCSGTVVSVGDTKAEENAWNARCLQTAIAMMPHHANQTSG